MHYLKRIKFEIDYNGGGGFGDSDVCAIAYSTSARLSLNRILFKDLVTTTDLSRSHVEYFYKLITII